MSKGNYSRRNSFILCIFAVLAASLVGTSGIFKSLFIAFVPRILVGVIPYFVYIGIKKVLASEKKISGAQF